MLKTSLTLPFGDFLEAGRSGRPGSSSCTLSAAAAAWLSTSHLLQLLVLPVHEGLPMLKELAFRPLEVLECPLPLDGAVLHSDDLSGRPRSRCARLGSRDRCSSPHTEGCHLHPLPVWPGSPPLPTLFSVGTFAEIVSIPQPAWQATQRAPPTLVSVC